ncbi:hypothetical protein WJX81_004611 [Elliptochloris bilobata]|uniref:Microsomal glutathione S-transferase 3 n=1 Tax=Elliptochloris bilobata TaxID=381761 RepID=A0AAW1RGQ2_9CHLO
MQALAITPEQGAVLASIGFIGIANQAMAIAVAKARKQYGVEYPRLYAEGDSENARLFNCVQRAHQNTLEQLPVWLAAQAALASVHPMTAGVLGFVWMAGRIVYFLGYSSKGPQGRLPGTIVASLIQIGVLGFLLVNGGRTLLGA